MISCVWRIHQKVRRRRQQWARLRSLPRDYQLLFLQTILLLPAIGMTLRCVRFQRIQQFLEKASAACIDPEPADKGTLGDEQDALPELVEAARLSVYYASRVHRGRFTCLPQSLSLWWLLRRRGFNPEVRLGARYVGEQFQAHAWVEYQGQSLELSSPSDSPFTPFNPPTTQRLAQPNSQTADSI